MKAEPALPERVRSMEGLGGTLCEKVAQDKKGRRDFEWASFSTDSTNNSRSLIEKGFPLYFH